MLRTRQTTSYPAMLRAFHVSLDAHKLDTHKEGLVLIVAVCGFLLHLVLWCAACCKSDLCGFGMPHLARFEISLFDNGLKGSCICFLLHGRVLVIVLESPDRARALSSTEQENEHEKPKNDASRISKCGTSRLTLRVGTVLRIAVNPVHQQARNVSGCCRKLGLHDREVVLDCEVNVFLC